MALPVESGAVDPVISHTSGQAGGISLLSDAIGGVFVCEQERPAPVAKAHPSFCHFLTPQEGHEE